MGDPGPLAKPEKSHTGGDTPSRQSEIQSNGKPHEIAEGGEPRGHKHGSDGCDKSGQERETTAHKNQNRGNGDARGTPHNDLAR